MDNGLIHIIDSVLVPPLGASQTITDAELQYLITVLSNSYLSNDYEQILLDFTLRQDTTLFVYELSEIQVPLTEIVALSRIVPKLPITL